MFNSKHLNKRISPAQEAVLTKYNTQSLETKREKILQFLFLQHEQYYTVKITHIKLAPTGNLWNYTNMSLSWIGSKEIIEKAKLATLCNWGSASSFGEKHSEWNSQNHSVTYSETKWTFIWEQENVQYVYNK